MHVVTNMDIFKAFMISGRPIKAKRLWTQRRAEQQALRAMETATPGMFTCVYLGGFGFPAEPGRLLRFGVGAGHLQWRDSDGRLVTELPFHDVLEATAHGAGQVTRDPGLRFVGFTPAGIAAGLATAVVLRKANTQTYVDSYLRVTTRSWEGTFTFTHATPQEIDLALARVRVSRRT